MDKEANKSTRDLLLQLIDNDLILARAFAAVARLRYDQGEDDVGDVARGKALKFYSEARRLLIQIAEEDRESDSHELENLRAGMMSLSMQPGDSFKGPSAPEEGAAGASLHKLFKRLGLRRN